jgi:NADH:ubiquinone oxidoreductase subunit K
MSDFFWMPMIAVVLSVAAASLVVLAIYLLWHPRRKTLRSFRLVQAKRRFHLQRERLEAKFIQLVAAHGKPNAPRWADCTFADDVAYVRNRLTGELTAFVAMTIAAEETDSSGSQTATSTVEHFQAGTAVFRFDRDHWETDGKAILNLNPLEAVRNCGEDFEMIGEELTHHSS